MILRSNRRWRWLPKRMAVEKTYTQAGGAAAVESLEEGNGSICRGSAGRATKQVWPRCCALLTRPQPVPVPSSCYKQPTLTSFGLPPPAPASLNPLPAHANRTLAFVHKSQCDPSSRTNTPLVSGGGSVAACAISHLIMFRAPLVPPRETQGRG